MQQKIDGTYDIQMDRELKMFADGRDKYLKRLENNSKLSTQNNPHKLITEALPKVAQAIQDYLLYEEAKHRGRKSCGFKDLQWNHKGVPHVDATCRTCHEQMVAENMDVDE